MTSSEFDTLYYATRFRGITCRSGYARLQGERLSRYQRGAIVSGHCDGWALYTERLCDELGWSLGPVGLAQLRAELRTAI